MAEERSPRGSVRTDIYLSIFLRKRVLLLLPPHDATRLILCRIARRSRGSRSRGSSSSQSQSQTRQRRRLAEVR